MHSNWHTSIHDYSAKHSTPEDPFLQAIHHFTWKKMINPRMLSEHLQGLLLSQLVAIHKPKQVLEIGTFTGYATACLLKNLLPDSEIHTIEADEEILWKTKNFWKQHQKDHLVNWYSGNALDILANWGETKNFDFIFVDADKSNYKNYLDNTKDILNINGIMLFDNTLWSNRVVIESDRNTDKDTKNMHEFNVYAQSLTEFETVLLPIRDGLTMMRKR
jgi:predicted O-methyltransferase YrrM